MKKWIILILFSLTTAASAFAGEMVTYIVDEQDFEGYFTSPGDDAPLVLLLHDWDGLTEYEVKRAEMLDSLGYAVFAADLFGKGIRPTEVKDKRQHTGELYRDRAKLQRLIAGAVEEAARLGGNTGRMVVMGYCFGGAAVLEYARSGANAEGFVTFHGGLATPDGQDYAKTEGSVLVFHGSADTAITLEQFADLAQQLEEHGVPHEMTTYGGAPHAFTVFDTERYRQQADVHSWQRFVAYLEDTLK